MVLMWILAAIVLLLVWGNLSKKSSRHPLNRNRPTLAEQQAINASLGPVHGTPLPPGITAYQIQYDNPDYGPISITGNSDQLSKLFADIKAAGGTNIRYGPLGLSSACETLYSSSGDTFTGGGSVVAGVCETCGIFDTPSTIPIHATFPINPGPPPLKLTNRIAQVIRPVAVKTPSAHPVSQMTQPVAYNNTGKMPSCIAARINRSACHGERIALPYTWA